MAGDSSSFERATLLGLLESSRAIISEPELDRVLSRVAEQATSVFDAEGASVLLLDGDRNELVFRAATGPKGKELMGERFNATLGIAGQALRTGRPVHVSDVSQNRNFFEGVDAKSQMRTRSIIAAPLIHMSHKLGVVEVINPRRYTAVSETELRLVELFANLAAAAVRSGQVFDRISRDNRAFREANALPKIVGSSKAMQQVLELCRKVAPSNATVLVTGETGTGKELVARAIHDSSNRREKPFVAINCAALPETLLESELFGHEKGAFTGAAERKLGRFELADGGTLFLDELGEMSASTQVKLLRVLQEREFVRVGGVKTIVCDVRIVAATNRDLAREMNEGRFREDLFYRLNVFPIQVPPLRDRLEDLPLLIDHFASQVAPSLGVRAPSIAPETLEAMSAYHWPGNVRELRNIVERCTLLAGGGEVRPIHLPQEIGRCIVAEVGAAAHMVDAGPASVEPRPMSSRLAGQEKAMILKALQDTEWNQSAAARQLGISRDHLRYRLKKYDLKQP